MAADEDTHDMKLTEVEEAFSKHWVLFCPWCGRRARLNTIKPLTINCDACECTTSISTIT